jgi:hypothetical protein
MVGIREVPEDWVYSSIVEHLSSMLKALGVIPSITTKEERERESNKQTIAWFLQEFSVDLELLPISIQFICLFLAIQPKNRFRAVNDCVSSGGKEYRKNGLQRVSAIT